MAQSTITVGGINPGLNILGATQQLNFNQPLSSLQINNTSIPTSMIPSQTNYEYRNYLSSGYRWFHLSSNSDTYGSLTLQNFVNAEISASGTNMMIFNSSGVEILTPLNMNGQNITNAVWNGATVTVPYGGSGITSATAYSVLCGGTTSSGAFQSVASLGTSGQTLTSQGANALPIWTNTGTVTSIIAGTGLSGGTITSSGTIAIANTAVTAGSYTAATITVNAQGQLTSASASGATIGPSSAVSGDVVTFNGTTGHLVQDSGILASTIVTAVRGGSAATIGIGTLNGTTGVTINTTAVTTSSIINITRNNGTSGAPLTTSLGNLSVGSIIANTSFTVYSSNVLDTFGFSWQIVG